MLYSEIIAVCSQTHTKHINTLCGQNVQLLNVKSLLYVAKNWSELQQHKQDQKKSENIFLFNKSFSIEISTEQL